MPRFYVPALEPGRLTLDGAEARHAARALRLGPGDAVELFDGRGHRAAGTLLSASPRGVVVEVGPVQTVPAPPPVTIAAALPKGRRADFMVEKLSELGVEALRPVRFARGVRRPTPATLARFRRLSIASAKQCGRSHVMQILDPLEAPALTGPLLLADPDAAEPLRPGPPAVVVIGPEGGLTPAERAALSAARPVRLTPTVLRVETAAIAAAAILCAAPNPCGIDSDTD
jgi:16S rRNA (uracil1498-N3)-methyltransferase